MTAVMYGTDKPSTLALSMLTDDEVSMNIFDLLGLLTEYEKSIAPLRRLLMALREEQTRRRPEVV